MLRGLGLPRILLVGVAQLAEIGVTEEAVVVEAHLGVEGDHRLVCRDDQRVDLGERRVALDEGAIQGTDERHRLARHLARQPEAERQPPRLKGLQADRGIHDLAQDLLRRAGRDLLDLDAALGARHHHDAPGSPVNDHTEVELPRDGEALLDEHPSHHATAGARLVRHQRLAEKLLRHRRGRLGILHHLDAARLAAAAGVNLRLDDARTPELARRGQRLGGCGHHLPRRHRHAVARQHRLRLELVNVHCPFVLLAARGGAPTGHGGLEGGRWEGDRISP